MMRTLRFTTILLGLVSRRTVQMRQRCRSARVYTHMTYEVAIVGGAVMGSSVAYFLTAIAPGCAVVVVEPDDTYEYASTLRASGGARRQFSCPENIAMSNFSIAFIERFAETMAVGGEPAHVDWRRGGYLFIVPEEGLEALRANHAVQVAHGVKAVLLDRD